MTGTEKGGGVLSHQNAKDLYEPVIAGNVTGVAARLRKACNGHPHAKVPWPHRVLHEGADTIDALVAACRAFVERFDSGQGRRADTDYVASLMRAALSKAEGR